MAMTPEETNAYYDSLFATGEATPGIGAMKMGKKGPGILGKVKGGIRRFGPELLAWYFLDKYLGSRHQKKMQDIQMQGARAEAKLSSPENLYYQASLPQVQQEEEMARTALFSQLSGGVLGPSLAKGQRIIGGG